VKQHRDIDSVIDAGSFTIEGSSRAGRETWFLIRQLGLALDIGRCPEPLFHISRIFLSHAHLDHAAGISFYANQRRLLRLGCGTIYVPSENVDDYRELMRIHEKLEGHGYPIEFVGLAEGEEVPLHGKLRMRVHRSTHRVPTNAYEVRSGGAAPSLLYYTGDTDYETLDQSEALYKARVLMIETSFTQSGDEDRAHKYKHLHVHDIFDRAERFENEMLVFTHFSLRDSPGEIHREISRSAPKSLRDRIRLALPEPYSKLA
jgi:ribonuclease Z